jgi:hypothetical protein
MTMNKISLRLRNEIEYLRALADMYEHESDVAAKMAALRAIEALESLSDTIAKKTETFSLAA